MQLNYIKSDKKKQYKSIFPDILILYQRICIRVQDTLELKGTRKKGDKETSL